MSFPPSEWPPSWGPQPQYTAPPECPPASDDYSIASGGSYAQKVFLRNLIPFVGGFMAKRIKPPRSASNANAETQQLIQSTMAESAKQTAEVDLDLWKGMNSALAELQTVSGVVANLETTSLRDRLFYLAAGIIAMCVLAVAVLIAV
jgi:hypothetical protein